MRTDGFELYPILHREKVYDLYAPPEIDMTFVEVRSMLDWLDGQGAFSVLVESESATLYHCVLPGVTLEVDVQGTVIVVYRRTVT